MCSAKRPKTVIPPPPVQAPKVALGGQRDDKMSAAQATQIRGERRDVAETRLNVSANAQREAIDAKNQADWFAGLKRYKKKHSGNPFKASSGSGAMASTKNFLHGNIIGKGYKVPPPALLVKHESAGAGTGAPEAGILKIQQTKTKNRLRF